MARDWQPGRQSAHADGLVTRTARTSDAAAQDCWDLSVINASLSAGRASPVSERAFILPSPCCDGPAGPPADRPPSDRPVSPPRISPGIGGSKICLQGSPAATASGYEPVVITKLA